MSQGAERPVVHAELVTPRHGDLRQGERSLIPAAVRKRIIVHAPFLPAPTFTAGAAAPHYGAARPRLNLNV
eukprot:scaffold12300_cov132-Isochrysis_galbana.AAC.3